MCLGCWRIHESMTEDPPRVSGWPEETCSICGRRTNHGVYVSHSFILGPMDERFVARCRSCAAKIIWTVTPSGAKAPIDQEPTEDGNVLLLAPTGLPETLAVTLSGDALLTAQQSHLRLRLNHFASCPNADEYKSD